MKKILSLLLLSLFLTCGLSAIAAMGEDTKLLPPKPQPAQWVNNFSQQFPDLLTKSEEQNLENKLEDFSKASGNQIALVIVDSLQGLDANSYAISLFNYWGIGNSSNDMGVLILVKPTKTEGGRVVYINTGYGAEALLPDITCKKIIDNTIIPQFKENEFYLGLDKASDQIIKLLQGEEADLEPKSDLTELFIILGSFIAFIALFFYLAIIASKNSSSSSSQIQSDNNHYYSSDSDYSSSHSDFGGGSSGGGGAGSEW